jgi:hypothetical protein
MEMVHVPDMTMKHNMCVKEAGLIRIDCLKYW